MLSSRGNNTCDSFLIGDDGSIPRQGGPLPMLGIQEGNVDAGIFLKVVGFGGLAIGMENQTNPSLFLPDYVS